MVYETWHGVYIKKGIPRVFKAADMGKRYGNIYTYFNKPCENSDDRIISIITELFINAL